MLRILVTAVFALALPLTALAGALVESLKGDAAAGGEVLMQGHRLYAPTAVATAAGGQVFLRFDDGMQIVLHENSLLRIIDFRYTPSGVTDRAVIDLLRGAARVVTGEVAVNNPKQFFFRTPQTQLTVQRPADFTVALVNPAYITVNVGSVLSSNAWGTASLNAWTTVTIASNAAAPAAIAASSLPPSAASAMTNLSVASVSAPAGGAAGGAAATAGTAGGAVFGTPLIVFGAAAAGMAALIEKDDGSLPAVTTTTHH